MTTTFKNSKHAQLSLVVAFLFFFFKLLNQKEVILLQKDTSLR